MFKKYLIIGLISLLLFSSNFVLALESPQNPPYFELTPTTSTATVTDTFVITLTEASLIPIGNYCGYTNPLFVVYSLIDGDVAVKYEYGFSTDFCSVQQLVYSIATFQDMSMGVGDYVVTIFADQTYPMSDTYANLIASTDLLDYQEYSILEPEPEPEPATDSKIEVVLTNTDDNFYIDKVYTYGEITICFLLFLIFGVIFWELLLKITKKDV